MATFIPVVMALHEALKAEDFSLPEECAAAELLTPVDGIFQLRYTVNLTSEQLSKVGRALTRVGESAK